MTTAIALNPASNAPVALLRPLLSVRATCGFPSPAEDFQGEELDLNKLCIRNAPATFFAEVDQSSSMVEFGIFPGDTLVIDRSIKPRHGHTILVLWEGGLMVKKLDHRGRRIRLLSGSPDHPPIDIPDEGELEVWGVVTWSFRRQI